MLEIPLTHAHTCLIDDQDLPLVKSFKWKAQAVGKHKRKFYAFTRIGGSFLSMHRLIMSAQKGQTLDHINGNSLDNRRKNLRFCTQAENIRNSPGWHKRRIEHTREHPIYKGVWNISRSKTSRTGRIWEAKLCWQGKQRYIGSFELPELAAMAYDDWARCFHGQFARLNFPQAGEIGVHQKGAL